MPSFLFIITETGPGSRAVMGVDDGSLSCVAAGVGVVLINAAAPVQFQLDAVAMFGQNAVVDIGSTGVVRNASVKFTGAVQLWEANRQLNNAGQIAGGSGVFMGMSGSITNSGRIQGGVGE